MSSMDHLLSLDPEPIVTILARLAEQAPDFTCLTVGAESITRAELEKASNRMARAFLEQGVGEGDFVTIGVPNSVQWATCAIATWKVGAVPQPISYRLPVAERQAIVELAKSKLVIGADPGDHPQTTCVPADFTPAEGTSDEPLPFVLSPYLKAPTSGGSTGRPKLILAGTPAIAIPGSYTMLFGQSPEDVQLVAGPLYHNAPLTMLLAGLTLGQHVVLLPKFTPESALAAITEHGVTWTQLVPTMLSRMLKVLETDGASYDLSSIKALWHMASVCPEWVKEGWMKAVGPEKVFELYGGTEMQSITIINGVEWLEHRGSVGKPVLGTMVVFDEDGKESAPGEVGEIYMRRAEGTPPTYHYIGAEAKERDGWESLGDLGWFDADGYLYISDRRTDMIVAGGANIYPAEVESALEGHPHVASCVVVGLPDADLGQRVHALVQLSSPVTNEELVEFLGDKLVRYKIPRSFEVLDEPLRDDAGKARRSALRDAAIERMSRV